MCELLDSATYVFPDTFGQPVRAVACRSEHFKFTIARISRPPQATGLVKSDDYWKKWAGDAVTVAAGARRHAKS